MKLVNLTQAQYRNYSNNQSKRNFGQTIEYSLLSFNENKKKLFLGLVDEKDNIWAAALILIYNVSPNIKEAIAPNGYLIDYSNYGLVKIFTDKIKEYLLSLKVAYLVTNPMFKNKTYNKDNNVVENNNCLLDNLIRLNYKSIGYFSEFEKYDVVLENYNSESDIYKNFNRNTRRNIKEALNYGITLYKGNINELEESYNIFRKKTKHNLEYYKNLMSVYNSNDNKLEIFFAKLNPHKYLVNVKRLYEIEKSKNERLRDKIFDRMGSVDERLLNKKVASDNALKKIKQELDRAIGINEKYRDNIIIGTSLVIRNNHEVYFLIDGYKEEFRDIHSTHILKWAIITKYFNNGYNVFNLGEINKNYIDKSNKYYGQYM